MKQVSFEVAKTIKNAGYPQLNTKKRYTTNGALIYCMNLDDVHNTQYDAPTYLEVWLWLWRKKGYRIREEITKITIYDNSEIGYTIRLDNLTNDPEEAIEQAIEYLCDNNLIK